MVHFVLKLVMVYKGNGLPMARINATSMSEELVLKPCLHLRLQMKSLMVVFRLVLHETVYLLPHFINTSLQPDNNYIEFDFPLSSQLAIIWDLLMILTIRSQCRDSMWQSGRLPWRKINALYNTLFIVKVVGFRASCPFQEIG